MMKKLFPFLCFLGLALYSEAADLLVNLNPTSGADFNNAQSAIDAANTGDIIYLQALPMSTLFNPADANYGNLVVNKQITIVGHGYFLETAGLGNYEESFTPVPIIGIQFVSGSQGATLRNAIALEVEILTSNITLESDYINGLRIVSGANTAVTGCYIESQLAEAPAVVLESSLSGHVFSYSFIGYIGTPSEGAIILSAPNTNGAEFNHCNFANGNLYLGSNFVHNCIIFEGQIGWLQEGALNNNLFTIDPIVTLVDPLGNPQDGSAVNNDPTNQLVLATEIFAANGEGDLQWELQVTSPALNAGDDGQNIGMYTSINSYRPSGLNEDVPIFIELNYLDLITTEIVLPIDFVVFSPSGNEISLIQWTVIPDDLFVGVQDYTTFIPSDLVHGFLSIDVDALPNAGVIAINAIDNAGLESGFQFIPFQKDNTPILTPNLQSFEFFYNTDPGIGNGNFIDIEQSTNFEGAITFPTLITGGPTVGQNTLFVRVTDANSGVGTTYYHEFQFLANGFNPDCCDIDGDGFIGSSDFLNFLQFFSQQISGCENGDFNLDGIVDTGDLLIFLTFYGTSV